MGLSLSGPAALWGFKPLKSFSMPWAETWILGIGGYGLGWNRRFIPESCKSCRVLWASCLRLVGFLGLKKESNCPLRAFALSESSENVLPLAFSNDIPLGSCFECFKREYSVLVLTLLGVSGSSVSSFIPNMSCRYF